MLEETDGSKLFYADSPADGDPAPYVDFKQKSKNLKDFKKLVDSAIGSAANIGPAFVDKIVFNFTADPQQKTIRIKEVTVNKKGCPIVVLSQFRNSDREVQKLFNYDDSMVLGYVSSLSDRRGAAASLRCKNSCKMPLRQQCR